MKILAFEFSTQQRSVAVLNTLCGADSPGASAGEAGIQASKAEVITSRVAETDLFAMVESVLHDTGIEREQIELLAVGLGPGSYTGVRTALALVQGWHLAREIPAIGISSAECVAVQAQAIGLTGEIEVIIDAQRQEFYTAGYLVGSRIVKELHPLRIETLEQVQLLQAAGKVLVGPGANRWFPSARTIFPMAASVAELAHVRARSQAPLTLPLEPIYLRQPSFAKAPPARVLPAGS